MSAQDVEEGAAIVRRPKGRLKYVVREADGFNHDTVITGGQRLHVVEDGDGPLVILLHGFPETWHTWKPQIRALADAGYRVAVPDQRGYGRSGKPAAMEEYVVTELVADCVGIVEALGEEQAVIVGHDWGAMVAWTAAWTRPDVFRAVVGMSVPFAGRDLLPIAGAPTGIPPSALHEQIAGPDKVFYQDFWCRPGVVDAEFQSDPRGFLRDQYYSFSGSPYPDDAPAPDVLGADPGEVFEAVRSGGSVLAPDAVWRDQLIAPERMPDWLGADLDVHVAEFERAGLEPPLQWYRAMDLGWERLAAFEGRSVTVPALFVGSDFDVATLWGSEAIRGFPTTVPGLTGTVILPRVGHWYTREAPEATSAAILDFLGDLGD